MQARDQEWLHSCERAAEQGAKGSLRELLEAELDLRDAQEEMSETLVQTLEGCEEAFAVIERSETLKDARKAARIGRRLAHGPAAPK